jgi:alkylation response protein AidB-like acyl-CoA dehydrogenase
MTKFFGTPDLSLSKLADDVRRCQEESGPATQWPAKELRLVWGAGVPDWFIPAALGGSPRSNQGQLELFLELGSVCLTTTFILTQVAGAIRRIAGMADLGMAREILSEVRNGKLATLGVSHLTTSRQHQGTPALRADVTPTGYVLHGGSPWVTGGLHAGWLVTGAHLQDGQPLLVAVPTSLKGIQVAPPAKLLALDGSCTGPIHFDHVPVENRWVILPPGLSALSPGSVAATGGLQTSALALALTRTALDYLQREAYRRPDLLAIENHLRDEWQALVDLLMRGEGQGGGLGSGIDSNDLRARANSLVLRSTQSALTAAKGAGFIEGHPTGRWCREALFFLVWSCPPGVMQTQLCEFAGIAS